MRGRKPNQIILRKMIDYCNEVERILRKHSFDSDEFENDAEFQFACGMCIIQIGELVGRLSEDFINRYPNIPWRQIKGMRNIYAHEYDIIDNEIVWETITEEIPELKKKLEFIRAELSMENENGI